MAAPTALLGNDRPVVDIHEILYEELGIQPLMTDSMYAGGATYSIMIQRAAMAVEAGRANAILCVSAGKFPKVGAGGAKQHQEWRAILNLSSFIVYIFLLFML